MSACVIPGSARLISRAAIARMMVAWDLGTAAEEARPALPRRQVKRRQRAADHQAAVAAAAESPSTGAKPDGVSPPGSLGGVSPPDQAAGAPPPAMATTTSPSSRMVDGDITTGPASFASSRDSTLRRWSRLSASRGRGLAAAESGRVRGRWNMWELWLTSGQALHKWVVHPLLRFCHPLPSLPPLPPSSLPSTPGSSGKW